jgi:hypothetical protein
VLPQAARRTKSVAGLAARPRLIRCARPADILVVERSRSSWAAGTVVIVVAIATGCADMPRSLLPLAGSVPGSRLVLNVRVPAWAPATGPASASATAGRTARAAATPLPSAVRTLELEIGRRGDPDLVAPPPFLIVSAAGTQEIGVSNIPPGLRKRVFFAGRDAAGMIIVSGEFAIDFLPGQVSTNDIDLGLAGAPSGGIAAPTITSVSPASGPRTGGTVLTIAGTGFAGSVTVRIGSQAALSVSVNAAGTQITCTTPRFLPGGTVDVVVSSSVGGSVTRPAAFTYIACPTGVCFAPAVAFTTGISGPNAVAASDLNGDGLPDIVVVNQSTNELAVMLNTGGGAFAAPTLSSIPGPGPARFVAIGDLNNDGIRDVVVTRGAIMGDIVRFTGLGGGSFGPGATFAMDINPQNLVLADFNGNGNLDVATSNSGGFDVTRRLGDGAGGFGTLAFTTLSPDQPFGLAAGDFDGDGDLDLVTSNGTGATVSRLVNTAGTFGGATSFTAGSGADDVETGDVNGDGRPDAVTSNSLGGDVSVLVGLGGGSFSAPTNFAARANPRALALADLDLDGDLDVATANGVGGGDVSVLLGSGTGSFAGPLVFPIAMVCNHLAVADLNGDTLPDLVVANQPGNRVFVLLAN